MKEPNNKNLRFISLKDLPQWKEVIESIQANAKQGWIWNSNEMFEFRNSCLQDKYETIDLSFVIYLNGQAIGFFFMLVFKESSYFTGGFSAAPLYWPCFLDDYNNIEITRATFSYIDKISTENNVGLIKIMSRCSSLDFNLYSNILADYKYLDESYESHIVIPKQFTMNNIRPKYRQMIKKYVDKFTIQILNAEDINEAVVRQYYELHVLDSGSKHRDISTYFKQFEIFNKGGFMVCAFNKGDMKPVGMLQILIDKHESYDASVAVNPEFKNLYISHILKQYAIENMKNLNVDIYELGPTCYYPTWAQIPTRKSYGINLFKDGWSRGQTRKTYSAIKFYNQEALNNYFISKEKDAKEYLYQF